MIPLTRLDGHEFILNAELIEHVDRTPDTIITLVNGAKYVVREPLDEIRARVLAYRREIFAPDLVPNALDRLAERGIG